MDADFEKNRAARSRLCWAGGLCLFFIVVEVVGGYWANSLAIMTVCEWLILACSVSSFDSIYNIYTVSAFVHLPQDALHLTSDLAGFGISIFALWLAAKPATSQFSYGLHRAEIIGALFSVLLIWVISVVLIYQV
jgi:zinc transporter 2